MDEISAWGRGHRARTLDGEGRSANPYPAGSADHEEWVKGWLQGDAPMRVQAEYLRLIVQEGRDAAEAYLRRFQCR